MLLNTANLVANISKHDYMPCGVSTALSAAGTYNQPTPSASANTKGSWTQIVASTAAAARSILIRWYYNPSAATPALSGLFDVGVGGSGSEVVIIPNLSYFAKAQFAFQSGEILVPFTIPAGSRISVRCQASAASATDKPSIHIQTFAQGFGANGIDSLTADPATSTGVSLQPVNGSKSSYSELIGGTTRPYKGIFFTIDNLATVAGGNYCVTFIDFATGAAAAEVIFLPDYFFVWFDSQNSPATTPYIPFHIPTGTRIAVRSKSNATSNIMGVAAYGVY